MVDINSSVVHKLILALFNLNPSITIMPPNKAATNKTEVAEEGNSGTTTYPVATPFLVKSGV